MEQPWKKAMSEWTKEMNLMFSVQLGLDPAKAHDEPSYDSWLFIKEIYDIPEVKAIWGPYTKPPPPRPWTYTTASGSVVRVTGGPSSCAGVVNEGHAGTTLPEASPPEPQNAVEHSSAAAAPADGVVGSGLDDPASAALALSSPIMRNDPRSPRPPRPAPMGRFALALPSTPRPATVAAAVPPGVQTPMPSPVQTQQAPSLTTDSPPASAARLAGNQESSTPAAPKKNHIYNAGSPAVTRKRGILANWRARGNKENIPPLALAPTPGDGLAPYRTQQLRRPRQSVQQLLAPLQGILPPPPPAPASPASSDRPVTPASSGPWTPLPFPGTRTVDPNQDVSPLKLPPAVYSVSFVAPKGILVDSFADYPETLPPPHAINVEHLEVLRGQHPGGAEENANAGNVGDDEDEPMDYVL